MEPHIPVPSVAYPETPIEEAYRRRGPLNFFRGLRSQHTRDLLVIGIFITLFAAYLIWAIGTGRMFPAEGANTPVSVSENAARPEAPPDARRRAPFASVKNFINNIAKAEIIAAIVAAWFSIAIALYWQGKSRFSTVDCFSGEVFTIIRLFLISKTMQKFINFYKLAVDVSKEEENKIVSREFVLRPTTFSTDHFQIYHNRSAELGNLNTNVVHRVSEFYTILKYVQNDMNDIIHLIRNNDITNRRARIRIIDFMYLMDILMITAYFVLEILLGKGRERYVGQQITLYIGEMANIFFREEMANSGLHDDRIRLSEVRFERYRQLSRRLPKQFRIKPAN